MASLAKTKPRNRAGTRPEVRKRFYCRDSDRSKLGREQKNSKTRLFFPLRSSNMSPPFAISHHHHYYDHPLFFPFQSSNILPPFPVSHHHHYNHHHHHHLFPWHNDTTTKNNLGGPEPPRPAQPASSSTSWSIRQVHLAGLLIRQFH